MTQHASTYFVLKHLNFLDPWDGVKTILFLKVMMQISILNEWEWSIENHASRHTGGVKTSKRFQGVALTSVGQL